MPKFQKYFRKAQHTGNPLLKLFYKSLFVKYRNRNFVEMSVNSEIGEGLYIGHPFGITINPLAKIGRNVNIHKGVTIGQENRGEREGTPIIGDEVWIGINATIVGKVKIGTDVLIAPNTFVNCDIPDHCIVFGNPCIIKKKFNATEGYINRKV
ncbi:MAG: serine acetyltransferase [Lachnospiraceae bacterium]|nr:serine acetyltransferase [Lachnospiraceae bacterium]